MKQFLAVIALFMISTIMTGCSTVQAQPEPSQLMPKAAPTQTSAPQRTPPPALSSGVVTEKPLPPVDHAAAPSQSSVPYGATVVKVMQPNGFLQIEIHFTPAQYDAATSQIGPTEGVVDAETAGKVSFEAVQAGNDHLLFSKPVDGIKPTVMYAIVIDKGV